MTMLIFFQITPEKFEKLSGDIQNIIGHGSPTVFKGVILLVSVAICSFVITQLS